MPSDTALSPLWHRDPDTLPRVARPDLLAVGLQNWRELLDRIGDSDAGKALSAATDDAFGAKLLEASFANSPFLTHCLLSDPEFTRTLLQNGPNDAYSVAVDGVSQSTAKVDEPEGDFMRRLRMAKRRVALTAGLADISGTWPLDRVIRSLSGFADAALQAASRRLLLSAHQKGEIRLPAADDPERGSGYIVLGMGKLGAGELNYSSDIDLIVLYDLDRVEYTGKDGIQQCFVRLTRNLVRMLDERTRDGYVFRTDLRLRPDPGAMPLAISTLAAETYYESAGQNWERAAMIKARPVAGDIEAGNQFLEILRPFIWRRNLDFAAIQDIHSIKRQINAYRGGATVTVPGHNVKLGRGGIREIEFFVQTQQLIWGGRDLSLRGRETLAMLKALVDAGHVDAQSAESMTGAYRFLRTTEHRLQMIGDQQTHKLPEADDDIAAFAAFMGFDSRESFEDALVGRLREVESRYANLFEESPNLGGPGNLVFTGGEDDPDTLATLQGMGFKKPEIVSKAVREWHHGRYRSIRTNRSKQLLTELMPVVLQSLSKTLNPDAAFLKFDEFLSRLPSGVQLFSLFHSHPSLLDLVSEIMGEAPRLADWLSRNPILLDAVVDRGFFEPPPPLPEMQREIAEDLRLAADLQDVIVGVQRWTNDNIFRIGVQMMRGTLDAETAGGHLSDVADTGLETVVTRVIGDFAERHGRVPGGMLGVVALGKLGGREFTVGSDLDLLFVYDLAGDVDESDGPKPLHAGTYYARLAQRIIGAVTAPTGEGKLYEVDMRLRPAGNAGPIASSLPAFVKYQNEDAWTWEHMVLTRARVVWAEGDLGPRMTDAISGVLRRKRDPEKLRDDVVDMRRRIQAEHGTDRIWNIKHYRGGMVDIEFAAQYLQLLNAHDHPEILATNTTDALEALKQAGLLGVAIADELIAAMHLWRRVQGFLRLAFGAGFDGRNAPEGLQATLVMSAGAGNLENLEIEMADHAERVVRHCREIYGAGGES